MNDLNSINIEGAVTRCPIHRKTKKGDSVCTFIIATNRFFKAPTGTEKEVSYFEIEAWQEEADKCHALIQQPGRHCRIKGRLRQERWKSQNGESRSKVVIVAESVEFRPGIKTEEKRKDHETE